jgi:DNA polymerase III epsilon subunit-like protein
MILLSLDFETTGTNKQEDHVIEYGGVLYSTSQHKCLDSQGILVNTDRPITPEITKITGITKAALDRFGYSQSAALAVILETMMDADAILGYNVRRFDKPVLQAWLTRQDKTPGRIHPLWIDVFADLPWNVPVSTLTHTAADHGILNLFPHSAMADAQTALVLAGKYDYEELLHRAQAPVVILRSHQEMGNNDAVKQAPFRFRWNPPRKIWWKPVKNEDVKEVMEQAPFRITIEKDLSIEELDQ